MSKNILKKTFSDFWACFACFLWYNLLTFRTSIHSRLGIYTMSIRIMPANSKVQKLYSIPELKCYLEAIQTIEINRVKQVSKYNRRIYNFDLRAGYTCPAAHICMSRVIENEDGTRKIQDGKNTIVRCFAATIEVLRPKVYNLHKQNEMTLRELKTESKMQFRMMLESFEFIQVAIFSVRHISRLGGMLQLKGRTCYFTDIRNVSIY